MLCLTPLPSIPLIKQGDNLAKIMLDSCRLASLSLADGDIFVLAQKIVSKSEGRIVRLADVKPSPRAFRLAETAKKDPRVVELILQESGEILRVRPGLIIAEHKQGFVCANAGIDKSNVAPSGGKSDENVLLLPKNADISAKKLRAALEKSAGRKFGVLIIDSHGRAWRNGIVGMAIGISGLPALADRRGEADLFGRPLKITQVGAADELAGAASLLMGQGAEATPIIHVRGFPYPLREGSLQELIRPKAQDLFR